ncbi:MAG: protein translocase subunit SecD [Eubacteriales bacterium]|nr:protein translocase subunit SecD [Eubacteriales bacterium]
MNYQRAVSVSRFILILLCIGLLVSVAVFGFSIGEKGMEGVFEEGTITLGLDLAGGSSITYQANTEDTGETLNTGMNSVLSVMRQRLDSQGLTEANAFRVGDDMVTVEIPSVSDPAKAAETLMATAVLTFRDYDKNILLEGNDVKSAKDFYTDSDGDGDAEYIVELTFNESGVNKFTDATKAAAQATDDNYKKIYIYMDEALISAPSVESRYAETGITGGTCIISGSFDAESAAALAGQINAGALKYTLSNVDQRTIGATLGEKSLTTSLKAGAFGIILVMLFLIIYYRVPGLMASVSLIAYMAVFAIILVVVKANLTLPGIAGIILSIGMAVDANVVIFERVKEEIKLGKSAKAAVEAGHHHALSAVIDSNVTTLIAAGVLYFLGAGTIKGFAITLGLGVIISMFSAIFLTHWLLRICLGMGISDIRFYGVNKDKTEKTRKFHFINNKKITYIIVGVVLITGLLSFVIRGFNLDIDFSGGSQLDINLGVEVTPDVCDQINSMIENNIGANYVSSTKASLTDNNVAVIRTGTAVLSIDQQQTLNESLKGAFPDANFEDVEYQSISPIIGDSLKRTAVLAVILAVVLMLAYIWYRFQLLSGLSAIICLMHDLFVMLILYSLFQIPVNSNIIAALLTILGYSINASIVVFDRVRENKTKFGAEKSFGDTVDISIKQTLARSANTSLTTLLTIGMVYIFGVDSIKNFALPIIVGLCAGLFSSLFLAGLLWVEGERIFKNRKKATK